MSENGTNRIIEGILTDNVRTHPNFIRRLPRTVDDNVGTLSHSESDHACVIRFYGHEIVRDYLHGVPIDSKFLHSIASAVDQTKKMILARGEFEGAVSRRLTRQVGLGAREAHLAVDQVAVGERIYGSTFADGSHESPYIGHVVVTVPIAEHHWTAKELVEIQASIMVDGEYEPNVNIGVFVGGTVNDHGTYSTTRVLS